MKTRKKKSAAPFYAFAISWLLCSGIFPLFRLSSLLITFGISLLVCVITGKIANRNRKAQPVVEEVPKPKAEETPAPKYSPEVEAIIDDGKKAMKEMGRLYASIRDPEIKKKINEIMRVSDKIVNDAIQDNSDVPQIRKFLNYYLPTTIKLLNAYDRMSDQGIEGSNLSKSMQSIESMLDTTIEAYKKQLDSLFENQALDIETDITVMNSMLAREGLTGGGELDDLISKAAREQAEREEEQKRLEREMSVQQERAKSEREAREALEEARRKYDEMQKKQSYTNAEDAMKQAAHGSYSSALAEETKEEEK